VLAPSVTHQESAGTIVHAIVPTLANPRTAFLAAVELILAANPRESASFRVPAYDAKRYLDYHHKPWRKLLGVTAWTWMISPLFLILILWCVIRQLMHINYVTVTHLWEATAVFLAALLGATTYRHQVKCLDESEKRRTTPEATEFGKHSRRITDLTHGLFLLLLMVLVTLSYHIYMHHRVSECRMSLESAGSIDDSAAKEAHVTNYVTQIKKYSSRADWSYVVYAFLVLCVAVLFAGTDNLIASISSQHSVTVTASRSLVFASVPVAASILVVILYLLGQTIVHWFFASDNNMSLIQEFVGGALAFQMLVSNFVFILVTRPVFDHILLDRSENTREAGTEYGPGGVANHLS